jgi:hypothetical protein
MVIEDEGHETQANHNFFQCSSEDFMRTLVSQAGFQLTHSFKNPMRLTTPDYEAYALESPIVSKNIHLAHNAHIFAEVFTELRRKPALPSVGFIFVVAKKPSL